MTTAAPTAPPALPLRIQALLEETLLPNPGSVELQRDPVNDYLHRLTSTTPHVAELFLENTKIAPGNRVNGAIDETMLEAARGWFFATAYKPREGDFDPAASEAARVRVSVDRLGPAAGRLAGLIVRDPIASRLLYALDVIAVIGCEAFRVLPQSDDAWLVRRMSQTERAMLAAAVVGARQGTISPDRDMLVIVSVPWRYMVFQGPRGARRALTDAGRMLSFCETAALSAGINVTVEPDYVDGVVDETLLLDGVERTTIAVMTVTEGEGHP